MTKSLTEKWKDGDLADDCLYYWRISNGQILVKNKLEMYAFRLCSDAEKIECLAPVPSYDEWQSYEKCADMLIDVNKKWEKTIKERKQLEKKLEIATKALEEYANCKPTEWMSCVTADKALKEMEVVK